MPDVCTAIFTQAGSGDKNISARVCLYIRKEHVKTSGIRYVFGNRRVEAFFVTLGYGVPYVAVRLGLR